MARIVDKLKRYFSDRNVRDIAPPEAAIPRGLAPDIRSGVAQRTPSSHAAATDPRAGGERAVTDRSFGASEETTEELLTLSDETPATDGDNGFDPYNTGAFRSTGSWTRGSR